jgi:glutaredoxin
MYTIYTKPNCPHCVHAKDLLKGRDLPYTEINVDVGQMKIDGAIYVSVADLKAEFPTVKTVPVIIVDGVNIGGFVELRKFLSDSK